MHTTEQTQRFVEWVRAAAPYIHAFGGRTFVIGFGGELAVGPLATAFAQDCNLLAALGIRLVLVHGARPQIEAELARRGLQPRYHRGLRVTDAAALECVKAATSVTRLEIEALLSQGLPNTPMAGAYMRVTGGNFVVAKPVGVVDGVDYQYTGAVRKVIAEEIAADLDQENVALISPLALARFQASDADTNSKATFRCRVEGVPVEEIAGGDGYTFAIRPNPSVTSKASTARSVAAAAVH